MSANEHICALLEMAEKDLKALRGMTDSAIFDDEIFGFHAQQTVEKSLKAWIASLGETYPLTHDIRYLLLILSKCNCDIAELKDLIKLNLFAVQFRYEPVLETSETINRSCLLDQVENAFKRICTEIKTEFR